MAKINESRCVVAGMGRKGSGEQVAAPARGHDPLAVRFLDLDDCKAINDHYGHAVAMRVLHAVGPSRTT